MQNRSIDGFIRDISSRKTGIVISVLCPMGPFFMHPGTSLLVQDNGILHSPLSFLSFVVSSVSLIPPGIKS